MDAGIQSALTILSTISGPSPVLDGLVDQIVATGLPMISALAAAGAATAAAAAAGAQPAGATTTASSETTARMLLSGVQRASEYVGMTRRVALVRGVAQHVLTSPMLSWPIRAFAMKTIQTMISGHFTHAPTADAADAADAEATAAFAAARSEVITAVGAALVQILHHAHALELAKALRITGVSSAPHSLSSVASAAATPSTAAFLTSIMTAPHPFHNVELKSATDLFGVLSELDAEAVAEVYAPKQKAHLEVVSELLQIAAAEAAAATTTSEDGTVVALPTATNPATVNIANHAIAQMMAPRFDLVLLGMPRTASLRGAMEKINCAVLKELTKELGESMNATEAVDALLGAYPFFFGNNNHNNNLSSNSLNHQSAASAAATEVTAAAAATTNTTNADSLSGVASTSKTDAFVNTIKNLVLTQNISKETVCAFLKVQMKDALTRAGAELVASASTAAANTAEEDDTIGLVASQWQSRLRIMSRNNLFARPAAAADGTDAALLSASIIELVYGLLAFIAASSSAATSATAATSASSTLTKQALLILARDIESFVHRSLPSFANIPPANKAEATAPTSPYGRVAAGATLVLRSVLPTSPLPTAPAVPSAPSATVTAEEIEATKVAAAELNAANDAAVAALPLPMLEVAMLLLLNVTERPIFVNNNFRGNNTNKQRSGAANKSAPPAAATTAPLEEGETDKPTADGAAAVSADGCEEDNAAAGNNNTKKRAREEEGDEDGAENNSAADDSDEDEAKQEEAEEAEEEDAKHADEEARKTSTAANNTNTSDKRVVTLHGEGQELIATVCRGGLLAVLLRAYSVLTAESNTIDLAKRLKSVLGAERCPPEVFAALGEGAAAAAKEVEGEDNAIAAATTAPASSFLSVAEIEYRKRVLNNVMNIIRIHLGFRVQSVVPSYVPTTNANHYGHHGHGHGHRNNNNNSHQNNRPNNNTNSGGNDFKKHRVEGSYTNKNNNNNNGHANHNNNNNNRHHHINNNNTNNFNHRHNNSNNRGNNNSNNNTNNNRGGHNNTNSTNNNRSGGNNNNTNNYRRR